MNAQVEDQEPIETFTTSASGPSINYLVHLLSSSLAKGSSAYYGRNFGLSLPEMRILSTLRSHGALSARDMAEHTAMDKAMISRVLGKMHKRGLIEPDVQAVSLRLRNWDLSEAGRDLVVQVSPEWKRREAILQARLTAKEKAKLEDHLKQLIDASEELRRIEAKEF